MNDEGFDIELLNLGNRIRNIRKGAGLTQTDLELSTGIHRSDISKIENGQENLEFLTVFRIAKALNIPTKELLNYGGSLPVNDSPKKTTRSRKKAAKKKKP